MKRLALLTALALTAMTAAAQAAPQGDLTTARVVSIQTDWTDGGQTRVELEIAGQLVTAKLGAGAMALAPGQTTTARIYRDAQRQWVVTPVITEIVANN